MNVLEIWTGGDPEVIATIFQGVAMLVSGGDLAMWIKFGALVSLLIGVGRVAPGLAGSGVHGMEWYHLLTQAFITPVAIIAIGMAMIGWTSTVTIEGVYSTEVAVVDGVPAIMAYPAHYASSIGQTLTQQTDQVFSTLTPDCPDSINRGADYCMRIVEWYTNPIRSIGRDQKSQSEIVAVNIAFQNYWQNCIRWDVGLGYLDPSKIINSDHLIVDLAPSCDTSNGPGSCGNLLPYTDENGIRHSASTCSDVYAWLSNLVTTNITDNELAEMTVKILKLDTNVASLGGAATNNPMDPTHLEGASLAFLGIAAKAKDLVAQRLLLIMEQDALHTTNNTGTSGNAGSKNQNDAQSILDTLATIAGTSETQGAMQVTGQITQKFVPALQGNLEGLTYALFPFVPILLFIPGNGLSLMKEYFINLIFVNLLMPVYLITISMVQLIAIKGGSLQYPFVFGNTNPEGVTAQGMDLAAQTMSLYLSVAWDMVAVAIPVSYALVRGGANILGGAMGEMTKHISIAGSGNAGEAAGTRSMGNKLESIRSPFDGSSSIAQNADGEFGFRTHHRRGAGDDYTREARDGAVTAPNDPLINQDFNRKKSEDLAKVRERQQSLGKETVDANRATAQVGEQSMGKQDAYHINQSAEKTAAGKAAERAHQMNRGKEYNAAFEEGVNLGMSDAQAAAYAMAHASSNTQQDATEVAARIGIDAMGSGFGVGIKAGDKRENGYTVTDQDVQTLQKAKTQHEGITGAFMNKFGLGDSAKRNDYRSAESALSQEDRATIGTSIDTVASDMKSAAFDENAKVQDMIQKRLADTYKEETSINERIDLTKLKMAQGWDPIQQRSQQDQMGKEAEATQQRFQSVAEERAQDTKTEEQVQQDVGRIQEKTDAIRAQAKGQITTDKATQHANASNSTEGKKVPKLNPNDSVVKEVNTLTNAGHAEKEFKDRQEQNQEARAKLAQDSSQLTPEQKQHLHETGTEDPTGGTGASIGFGGAAKRAAEKAGNAAAPVIDSTMAGLQHAKDATDPSKQMPPSPVDLAKAGASAAKHALFPDSNKPENQPKDGSVSKTVFAPLNK